MKSLSVVLDPQMPLVMRLMGRFGTTPERSAQKAIRLLTTQSAADANDAILRKPKAYAPEQIALYPAEAA
ncbi:hypothetical protein [Novosphingobium sp. BL-52-GroH]|uniref:hypothetical protein n=1 Tax=Novosphingobium sp. BL-52-GroH TaxID=3349877 RepID=UPI00384E8599